MTLDELKKQNAEADAGEQVAQPDPVADDDVQADNATPENDSVHTGDDGEEKPVQEVPLWMQTDEQTSVDGQMPVKSHIAVKQKLKGRLNQKETEIDQLRHEIEAIKSGASGSPSKPVTEQTAMPRAEEFYDAKDPDAAYAVAMNNWVDKGVERRLNAHLQKHQQQQNSQQLGQKMNQSLEQHYDRAATIVSEGLLTADEYQNSEILMRQAVDAISPGNGDAYVESLLSRMGDGSEKLVVSLARNASHMQAFQQALRDDPSGISAATFLGELKGTFRTAKRYSQTPRPGHTLKGDGGSAGDTDKRQYNTAHTSGDRQKAFNIKRAAKLRGVDVSQW